jgi:hypothetical protein
MAETKPKGEAIMAETKPKDEAQVTETPQEGRTKSELAAALMERANMLRAEWNTNSDHPKGREAHELAALLQEAALALVPAKK